MTGNDLSDEYLNQIKDVLIFDFNHNGRTYATDQKQTPFEIKLTIQNKELKVLCVNHQANKRYRYKSLPLKGVLSLDRIHLHKISDQIHQDLFHAPGICATKILYSQREKQGSEWVCQIYQSDYDGYNAKPITANHEYNVAPCYIPIHSKRGFQDFLYVSYRKGQPKIYKTTVNDPVGTPLLSISGNQLLPSVSSQCDMISFICDAPGRCDLFLQRYHPNGSANGKPIQIFSSKKATQATSTFSPDGKKLAFVSDKNGPPRIYVLDIPSQNEKTLKETTLITKKNRHNSGPNWSPDGKKLAYSAKVNGVGQIYIYDFETQEEMQLTYDPINKENPKWAPDSFHLIYNTEDENHSELYIINLNQKLATQITSGAGQKRFPCWEPSIRKRLP